jgi:hypothetical protein
VLATPRPLDGMSTAGDWSGATAATRRPLPCALVLDAVSRAAYFG